MTKIDKYVIDFCNDALNALKNCNENLGGNLKSTKYKSYYNEFPKGIFVRSLTEPILKFIIFLQLCCNHKMFPEAYGFYNGRQLLDLAIQSPYIDEKKGIEYADIGVEMKWAKIGSKDEFLKWSLTDFKNDILKLHKNCIIENKYIMQFMLLEEEHEINTDDLLKNQLINDIDGRLFKNGDINLIYKDFFDTAGIKDNETWKFYIILWKIR